MEELVMAERVKSIPKEIRSLERRIEYLVGRKEHLMKMVKDFADKRKRKIEEKAVVVDNHEDYPPKLKKHKVNEGNLAAEEEEEEEHSAGESTCPDSAAADPSLPPLTPRYPLQPEGSDMDDFREWAQEYERVKKLNAPLESLPTQIKRCKDPATRAAVVAPDDKRMLLRVADFVVSVSYRPTDCDDIVSSEADANRKVYIHWQYMPDSPIEGKLLFVSRHYQIALLEIPVDVHSVMPQLEIPSFGSYPNHGQEVFTLARDKDLFLMARRGTIMRAQQGLMFRSHDILVDYGLPDCGAGGPVVDRSGDVVGMSLHGSGISAVLSISTAISCIDMWTNFGRIARPLLEMRFKNVELLDEPSGSRLGGFIVDRVDVDSTAWELGIRRGNVISFNGHCSTPLPEFEDFLLSYGLAHLQGKHRVADFKLKVCDHDEDVKRNINLCVPFSDVSEGSSRRTSSCR
ncbi:unnamed protein product [Urochloa decumbens]|uniref:Uncharacterized protein n=1 Tax=Urochloa decumbens TaxID=240449 RepID=A0ABC9H216_9POAL